MNEHIKKMIGEISQRFGDNKMLEGMPGRFMDLHSELIHLETRDFLPASRFEFVSLKRRVRNYLELTENHWDYLNRLRALDEHKPTSLQPMANVLSKLELLEKYDAQFSATKNLDQMAAVVVQETQTLLADLSKTLDSYVGDTSLMARSRQLPFVRDRPLREIAERDYRELVLKIFPAESWKSAVILAGSILEALLHDLLTRDASWISAAMSSARAPQRPRSSPPPGPRDLRSPAPEDEWTLNDYIEVAEHLTLLPQQWKASVQVVLRDFRNCVHPRRELKLTNPITQGEAFQAVGAIIRICDHVEKNHP